MGSEYEQELQTQENWTLRCGMISDAHKEPEARQPVLQCAPGASKAAAASCPAGRVEMNELPLSLPLHPPDKEDSGLRRR